MANSLCSYCNRPVTGRYYRDYWGNKYHAEHMNTAPSCSYCGRLISKTLTRGGTAYSDGRRICMLCHKTAIDDPVRGKKILRRIHDELAVTGIDITPFQPEFYLLDRSRLKSLAGSAEKQGFARFERELVKGKVKSFKLQIYLLKGLPISSFVTAAAHELMHIWFYSRNITDLDPRLEEGSCNYAAYLILKNTEGPEAAYRIHELMEDNSPVYGKGFQKVYKMVESRGMNYWLSYVQRHRK